MSAPRRRTPAWFWGLLAAALLTGAALGVLDAGCRCGMTTWLVAR